MEKMVNLKVTIEGTCTYQIWSNVC